MRIGTYNMINQIYSTSTPKKSTTASSTGYTSFMDQISLSSAGKDMQTAKSALARTPDIREDKVSDIKARLADGSYRVDAESFAEKLMASYKAADI